MQLDHSGRIRRVLIDDPLRFRAGDVRGQDRHRNQHQHAVGELLESFVLFVNPRDQKQETCDRAQRRDMVQNNMNMSKIHEYSCDTSPRPRWRYLYTNFAAPVNGGTAGRSMFRDLVNLTK